jgi:putative endonuclease
VKQVPVPESYYVYIVCCANDTLYTGFTKNVEKRIAAHNAGRGGRYTRSRRPVTLLATWTFNRRTEALRAEREIKRLSYEQKLRLIEVGASERGDVV